MRTFSLDGPGGRLRARRWDVVMLGGALPGLVAAVRLGMAGLRVLVVEEETAAKIPPPLREPFFLGGVEANSLLQQCLVALGVPLIERRAIEARELAYQLILADARIDVGVPARTEEELVGWGLAKPEVARDAVRGLESAALAEAVVLTDSGVVRRGARRVPGPQATPKGRHLRGLPAVLRQVEPGFARLLEAQVAALSYLASGEPSPEARGRLLGAVLAGGAAFQPGNGLRTMVRRRVGELHGELRTVGAGFELAEIDGHPGLVMGRSRDAWIGRALVLNLPEGRLAEALAGFGHEVPPFLESEPPRRRRAAVYLQAFSDSVPEAMAERAILVDANPERDPIALAVLPSERGPRYTDLAAWQAVDESEDLDAAHDRIEAAVRELLPFAGKKVARKGVAGRPLWDDDLALVDLPGGAGWPTEADIRTGARVPVYRLGRRELAGLGAEGDLLLGWHAGDTLAASLG